MPETAVKTDNAEGEKYLIFSVFDRQYAFPAEVIGEVANCDAVYPLPLLPSYVLGFINRYSIPYALFDIGFLLFNTPGPRNEALVINSGIDRVAFSIDNVSGIASITRDKMRSLDTGTKQSELTSTAYASFNWNGGDVFVLDIRRVLACVTDEAVR